MSEIRVCQFFDLRTNNSQRHRYQNYFIGENKVFLGSTFSFAPFRAQGSSASLSGDNQTTQVLFPNTDLVIRLVEAGEGNRLSELTLTNAWLDALGNVLTSLTDYYVGTGATFSEDTVELRFRSALDSVQTGFPARTLTLDNVGVLPLSSELYLR